METEVLKEKLIQYLEDRELRYIEREGKISHQCVNPEHQENSPSAFTIFGEQPYMHCSSCSYHLNSEKLYKLLDLGFDPDSLFQSQINTMLKSLDKSKSKDKSNPTQIYLPIEEAKFEKEYRGISVETFKKVGAYYTMPDGYYGKRIIFPIRAIDGSLRGFEAVSTNKKIVPKILRPKNCDTSELLGFEEFIDSDTLFVCEGLFSALSFIECGYNGVFNFGLGSIKPKIKKMLMKGVRNIVICGDNDSAGKNFNKESYQTLKKHFTVSYFQYPWEFRDINKTDANDVLKAGGKDNFKNYVDKFLSKNLIF